MTIYDLVQLVLHLMGGKIKGFDRLQKTTYLLGSLADQIAQSDNSDRFSDELYAAIKDMESIGFLSSAVTSPGMVGVSEAKPRCIEYSLTEEGKRAAIRKAETNKELFCKLKSNASLLDQIDNLSCIQKTTSNTNRTSRQSIDRIASSEYNHYPLRRPQVIVFDHDSDLIASRFSGIAAVLNIVGIGSSEHAALSDLENQFDCLVLEKVRIPPHARKEQDEQIRLIVNHLVDWNRFEQENPTPQLLVGRIAQHGRTLRPLVYWLIGPGAIRNDTARLPHRLVTPSFLSLKDGKWFRAVMLEYPDRVEWIEPPTSCPDPTDPETRRAAWEAIPRTVADNFDVWPSKDHEVRNG